MQRAMSEEISADDTERTCSQCGQTKPVTDFDTRYLRESNRLACTVCRAGNRTRKLRRIEERERKIEQLRATKHERSVLLSALGFTPTEQADIEKIHYFLAASRWSWERLVRTYGATTPPFISVAKPRRQVGQSKAVRQSLYERQGGLCAYCGCQLLPIGSSYSPPPEILALEHKYAEFDREHMKALSQALFDRDDLLRDKLVGELNTAYSEWHAPYLRWRKEYGDRRAHADHIIPLARGGTDNVENLALACLPCNQSKHTFTAEEFARYRRSRFSQYRLKDELAMVARGLEFERRGYTGFRETAVVGAADSASLGEYLANARPLDNVSGGDKRA